MNECICMHVSDLLIDMHKKRPWKALTKMSLGTHPCLLEEWNGEEGWRVTQCVQHKTELNMKGKIKAGDFSPLSAVQVQWASTHIQNSGNHQHRHSWRSFRRDEFVTCREYPCPSTLTRDVSSLSYFSTVLPAPLCFLSLHWSLPLKTLLPCPHQSIDN